mgnify:CR=1 FL=1
MNSLEQLLKKLRELKINLLLDQEQLICRAPKGVLTKEIAAEISALKPEILTFLKTAAQQATVKSTQIPKSNNQVPPVLSFGQRRLWFLYELEGPSATYNMPLCFKVVGNFEISYFEKAINTIITRHEVLRYNFIKSNEGADLVIADEKICTVTYIDLEKDKSRTLDEIIASASQSTFNLSNDLLIRATVIKEKANSFYVVLLMHHIIADGWSIDILFDELKIIYYSLSSNISPELPNLDIAYSDYAKWQISEFEGEGFQNSIDYWKRNLAECPDFITLKSDFPRPNYLSYKGGNLSSQLSKSLTESLKQLGQDKNCTLFMTLLTGFAILLSAHANQEDIVIGSPVANRNQPELEKLIGLFINTLPLRIDLTGNPTVLELLERIKNICLTGFHHQEIPFEKIVEEVNPKRSLNYSPIYQVAFDVQALNTGSENHHHLKIETLSPENTSAKFDLSLTVQDHDDHLICLWNYSVDLFNAQTIQKISERFESVLQQMVLSANSKISDINLLNKDEHSDLLNQEKKYQYELTGNTNVIDLITRHACLNPDRIALRFESQSLSYGELDHLTSALARKLVSLGAGPEKLIAILLNRSIEMVVALIATMKSGSAYIPIDPNFPAERLKWIMEDAKPLLTITEPKLQSKIDAGMSKSYLIEDLIQAQDVNYIAQVDVVVNPLNIAYVIFTSGSTGRPKGVQVSHQALYNFLCSMQHEPGFTKDDKLLAVTTISFDIAGLELFLPLISGGEVVIASRETAVDGRELQKAIARNGITVMQATPTTWRVLLETAWKPAINFTALCGGEALPCNLSQSLLNLDVNLWNLYGPTETTIWSAVKHVEQHTGNLNGVEPIGKPIFNTQLFGLNQQLQLLPQGLSGELYIGGSGLARGYLNRPALTALSYVPNPFSSLPGQRLYSTGDLVSRNHDGSWEFLGRKDYQIKIRGYRIEVGEIEASFRQHHNTDDVVLIAKGNALEGDMRLIAYVIPKDIHQHSDVALRAHLKGMLPEYMIPGNIVALQSFPLTPNGKIDRKSLPEPKSFVHANQSQSGSIFKPTEQIVKTIWQEELGLSQINMDDNFFDLGGHSLLLTKVNEVLRHQFNRDIPLIKLFEHPTIRSIANWLDQGNPLSIANKISNTQTNSELDQSIAIIGIAGKYPGADNVDIFWKNLKEGKESIRFFSEEELVEAGIEPELIASPNYIRGTGVLSNVTDFDAEFFSYTPAEAKFIDPQQRLFLETAWEALENGGYGDLENQFIGVFAGVGHNDYLIRNIVPHVESGHDVSIFQLIIGNDKDFLATRVSYAFNLTGPSITLQTACSTSLVAVHHACRSLLSGECDMALAGGVAVKVPHTGGYIHEPGMITSPDGHCRAFDMNANGTVWGSGSGVVLLKPLQKAIQDRDTIYAVIKGSAINNDGSSKVGFTAPSVRGQVNVIQQALHNARVAPNTVDYIETHGTGTDLGDLIEITALKESYPSSHNQDRTQILGAVKTNIGHLNTAAGIAGLTKTVLALQNKQIPPTLHFQKPNPKLELEKSQFQVSNQLLEWPANEHPRRAGVSSFGIGGTNAHLVVEESLIKHESKSERIWQVIPLSARSPNALAQTKKRLIEYLTDNPSTELENIAYTLGIGRKNFSYRTSYAVESTKQLISELESDLQSFKTIKSADAPKVAFLFPGQGTQYLHLGRMLYLNEPLYKEIVDDCAQHLKPLLQVDLREFIVGAENPTTDSTRIQETWLTQPLLFVTEYALAQLWISWGVKPDAMIGHSLGEYVAACIAGVFDLETVLSLVAQRGRLMWSTPTGSMLAIGHELSQFDISAYPELSIATINSPSSFVVAGPDEAINQLSKNLDQSNIASTKLQTSHAFHSSMMDSILDEFKKTLQKYQLSKPTNPFVSNLTGSWISPEEACSVDYWVTHLRSTVQFSKGLETILSEEGFIFLEVGPKTVLGSLVKKSNLAKQALGIVHSLDIDKYTEDRSISAAVAKIWELGYPISWKHYYAKEILCRVPLPTYPFDRKRHWIDAPARNAYHAHHKLSGRRPLDEWFYLPHWRPTISPPPVEETVFQENRRSWMIFANQSEICKEMIQYLKELNQEVVLVYAGDHFERVDQLTYVLKVAEDADYEKLFKEIQDRNIYKILHFWLFDNQNAATTSDDSLFEFEQSQILGFHALISISKAVALQSPSDHSIDISILANQMHDVFGMGLSSPNKATIVGPSLVIPQEIPQLKIHCLDIDVNDIEHPDCGAIAQKILAECENGSIDPMIAYRSDQRMVPSYQQIELKTKINPSPYLENEGVYLITGGLGKVGLLISEYLWNKVNARLCLISRQQLPLREDWEQIIQSGDVLKETLESIMALENNGAQILILSADVADATSLEKAFETCINHYGKISGVFHAAGLPSLVTPFLELSPQIADAHFASKALGVYSLRNILQKYSIEFCCLISSTSAVLGGLGYAAYSAANIFMDHFASHENAKRTGTRWLTINWDAWNFANTDHQLGSHSTDLSMTPAESMQAFDRVITQIPTGRVIVATGDLESRFKDWVIREDWDKESLVNNLQHSRPNLDSPFEAPQSSEELLLTEIWQSLLGYSEIGVRDNFFELGGDSMLAIRLMSAIKAKFERQLPLTILIDNPTIWSLARVLARSSDLADESPLVALQTKGRLSPLFCVPGTGGSVIYLRSLANEMIEFDTPFYGLQAIRSPETNQPIQDITEIANLNIKALLAVQREGPYQLCGHSFGSWVALEMAFQLQNAGHQVSQLIVLDTGIPSAKDLSRIKNWDDSEWLLTIAKTIGDTYNKNLLIDKTNLENLSWDEKIFLLFNKMRDGGLIDQQGSLEDVRSLVEMYKAQAQTIYTPGPNKVKNLALIRARSILDGFLEGMPAEMQNDPYWGWGRFSEEPPILEYVSGNHLTMVQKPNSKELALIIHRILQQRQYENR